jgi:hypothetical protein
LILDTCPFALWFVCEQFSPKRGAIAKPPPA